MSISRISSRYAKSLLELAVERNELDVVLSDMNMFKEVMSNRDFYLLLKSPIVNSTKKHSIFKVLFENKISATTMAFFDIIVKKGREMYLPEITNDFLSQYKVLKKISTVYLTTANPITEENLAAIKTKLLASSVTKDSIEFVTNVDPNLIGGFVIKIGDNLYDASVSHKLGLYKKDFVENKYIKEF